MSTHCKKESCEHLNQMCSDCPDFVGGDDETKALIWTCKKLAEILERLDICERLTKELRMLVLSRQKDESIMIGDDVEIVIVDVRGDKVRLGITAPREISVHRKEIFDVIQQEKKERQHENLSNNT